MSPLVAFWTYPARRLAWWLRSPEVSCNVISCARSRVGFSRYCRSHTDALIDGRISDSVRETDTP